ncbi:heme oxygenase (biliverdin-producing) [Litorihabitans aurantiacus]|uniref:Heme oxygenase n=1 Tax=Litorihabitans aurantiacus TaxID=1930061 RepID=A0AA37XFW5_9MICO|nr:biliverdin-producing heme oxygenase [Litorihabitans aurantiacus]GMA32758.1 heme oxygenase [Litorihabitans aurantiacus]
MTETLEPAAPPATGVPAADAVGSAAVAPEATAPPTLSVLLREATRPQHEHAETRSFVSDLMGGALGRDAYIDLTRQHHAIYTALEAAGERLRDDAVAAPFVLPELLRVPSLEADLAILAGPGWREERTLVPATLAYTARLDAIARPEHLLAHHYTRYLGDLSGGQIVARMLQRHYGMTPEELTFYTFADIPKPKPYKDAYRARLDAAPLTSEGTGAVVAEAAVAFDLNAALFNDLGLRHPAP